MSRVSARALLARKVRGRVSVLGRACPDAGTPALGLRCSPPGMQKYRRSLPCARHLIPRYVHELLRCLIACARHHLPRYAMGFKTLAIVRTMLFTKIFAWVFNDVQSRAHHSLVYTCGVRERGTYAITNEGEGGVKGNSCTDSCSGSIRKGKQVELLQYGRMCCREEIRGDAL